MSFWRDIHGIFFSLSGLTGLILSPPRNPNSSPTCSLSHHYIYIKYIFIYIMHTRITGLIITLFHLQTFNIFPPNAAYFISIDTLLASQCKMSRTVNFRDRKLVFLVHTCFYVPKCVGRWFWSWGTFFFFLIPLEWNSSREGTVVRDPLTRSSCRHTRAWRCVFWRKEVKRAKVTEKGENWRRMTECRRRAVGRLGEGGAQFTEAALNQPITVKENISWCVSSLRKTEWKARRASAYESYRNKYKAVSRAVTDMWLVPSSSSADGFQCEWICLRAYVEAC